MILKVTLISVIYLSCADFIYYRTTTLRITLHRLLHKPNIVQNEICFVKLGS